MEKVVLILNGVSQGKTQFIETIKMQGNYWTWNVNFLNVLSLVAHKLGWNGERNKDYYEWLEDEKNSSNHYFDSERVYINTMIDKFVAHDKVTVLIIHNCSDDLAKELIDKYPELTYSVLITDNDVVDDTYHKTLNYKNEEYTDNILSVMKTLTKSFSSENEIE